MWEGKKEGNREVKSDRPNKSPLFPLWLDVRLWIMEGFDLCGDRQDGKTIEQAYFFLTPCNYPGFVSMWINPASSPGLDEHQRYSTQSALSAYCALQCHFGSKRAFVFRGASL